METGFAFGFVCFMAEAFDRLFIGFWVVWKSEWVRFCRVVKRGWMRGCGEMEVVG